MAISKEHLALASEFAVASELCRRGIYAQLTLGCHKRTDLLVEADNRMIRVQVKGKQGSHWPGVRGLSGQDSLLVLVDYKGKTETQRPDFYVLTVDDWKAILERELARKAKEGAVRIDERLCPIWRDGYLGMAVSAEMVAKYKDDWEKVRRLLG